jgi:FlaA1/EpsC-like NDP-sugar epimerase
MIGLDWGAWLIAATFVLLFFERDLADSGPVLLTAAALVGQVTFGLFTGLYRGRFKAYSFEETGAVALTAVPVGATLLVVEHLTLDRGRGGQIIVLTTSIAVSVMFGSRWVLRFFRLRKARREVAGEPIIVYGAGEGGDRALHASHSLHSPYRVVAFVDDDPGKQRLRIGGVAVEGTRDDIERIAHRHGARSVLLALPSAGPEILRELHGQISAVGLDTLVMPPVQRLVGEGAPSEFERYRDEEILRRKIVSIDDAAVSGLLSGTDVLVTGAGGSIGSEIVRQLVLLDVRSVALVDHDDSLLHATMASLTDEQHTRCTSVLADIRDPDRLDEVFDIARPRVVFHAAALKHVPALEEAPGEGWKTNVLGTRNVFSACERSEAEVVVNISTDKAADPGNVLGFTKRIGERMAAAMAGRTGTKVVSVRFGNVIGSRGSAIETFDRQISEGGPVTVTDPDVTRYFMAVREAVRLTMQAAAIGRAGETLVLDMGSPVRVLDIAEQMIESSRRSVEIRITGLRPGEKMHEVLLGLGEEAERPFHPMIDHVRVDPLDLVIALDRCAEHGVQPLTAEGLRHIAHLPAEQSIPGAPAETPEPDPRDAS